MPNWVINNIYFDTDEKTFNKIVKFVKGEESDFDFNKVIPMPSELVGTTSPARIVSEEEYNEFLNKDKVDGYYSTPITKEMSDNFIEKYNANNWYDWSVYNWNTKWNACDVYIGDDSIEFSTAWSHPYSVIKTLSEKFSNVSMSFKYSDEDFGYNVGEYTIINGDEIDSFFPEGGSEEAYKLAFEIRGDDDFYIWDVFFDVDEEESIDNNTFYNTMIKLSYERYKDVDLDFPSNVLDKFLEIALEDENYELASKIKNK